MPIPALFENGYLPPGLHTAKMTEIEKRFGKSTKRRRDLFKRLELFFVLARHCRAQKILIDGSFVTEKPEPDDVDIVIRLDQYHEELVDKGDPKALELEMMFLSREPKEAFPAYHEERWEEWARFFGRVKGRMSLYKGLLELKL